MNELAFGVNWTAVSVGFVVSYFLGWLWYSPKLFGKKWAAGVGISFDEECRMPMLAMILQALGTFGLSWLIGVTTASNALLTAFLILLTMMLLIASNGKYARKSNAAVTIEAAYVLVMGIVMIACQAILQ